MKITLGKFARTGIEARMGGDIPGAVEMGLVHYTRRLRSGRSPVGVPFFCKEEAPGDTDAAIDISVGPETKAALEEEARRQQVPVTQLLTHAVLVYLADLDTIFGGETNGRPPALNKV